MTARSELADTLTPLLPDTWKIIPTVRNIDALDTVTVVLNQQRIEWSSAAPQGCHLVTFEVTIADPHTDTDRAEDALDDEVDTFLFALDSIPALAWSGATKAKVLDQYLGYNISLTLTTRKDI